MEDCSCQEWLLVFNPKGVVPLAQGETLGTPTEVIIVRFVAGRPQGFTLG